MGCCRSVGRVQPAARTRTAQSPSPCLPIEKAGDTVLVEVQSDGTLVPKAPYSSLLSMSRTLTVLGCQGFVADGLKELEITVMEAVADSVRAPKFWGRLKGRLVTTGAVRAALVASAG